MTAGNIAAALGMDVVQKVGELKDDIAQLKNPYTKIVDVTLDEAVSTFTVNMPSDKDYFSVRLIATVPNGATNPNPRMAVRVGTGTQIVSGACNAAKSTSGTGLYVWEFVEEFKDIRTLYRHGGTTSFVSSTALNDDRKLYNLYMLVDNNVPYPVGTRFIAEAKEAEY